MAVWFLKARRTRKIKKEERGNDRDRGRARRRAGQLMFNCDIHRRVKALSHGSRVYYCRECARVGWMAKRKIKKNRRREKKEERREKELILVFIFPRKLIRRRDWKLPIVGVTRTYLACECIVKVRAKNHGTELIYFLTISHEVASVNREFYIQSLSRSFVVTSS